MLKRVLAVLLKPPLPAVLGLILLTLVIFIGGREFRRWLGLGDGALIALCVLVWVVAAAVFFWRRYQAGKRARLIEDRLRGQAREQMETARPDRRPEIEALEKQLHEALGALKSSKMGRSALYALPWYVIIGPPGSGKTTLLRESGLNFPQMSHGRGVRGVGGTRNCDWWFTDAGILLDTAGRYTTELEDRNEWLAFLDMIKKARSRKPINGALIAISVAELLQASEEEVTEHARKIRERLAELTERLELVFPVYLVFTKCDLLDGFVEFFGSYSKAERAQVWGCTLPYLESRPEPLDRRFATEMGELYSRLGAERLHNLGGAKSQAKKRKVFSFPIQFTLARERLRQFVEQLAQSNPYHESSDVRGFYFTSGTQEGVPLDQILRVMGEAAGLQAEAEALVEEGSEKKAYFIDELFTQVVFPDQDLSQSSAKAERRRRVVRRASLIGAAAATFLLMILLFASFAGHNNRIDRAVTVCAEAAGFDPSHEDDLRAEEAEGSGRPRPFDRLRALFVELDDDYGSLDTYVLGQTNQIYEQCVRPLYVQKVRKTFVEPIQEHLRAELAKAVESEGKDRDVRLLSDQLTAYQMLGGRLLLNRSWLDDFLVRNYLWTWREMGQETPVCRPHRVAFVQRIASPAFRDWSYMPEEGLIPDVTDIVRGKDIYGRELRTILEEQGQAGEVPWNEILGDNPHAVLLDDSVGVTEAWYRETPLEDQLEKKGELLGDDSGEVLKTRRRQEAINEWKGKLADMRPRRKSNLEHATADVVALTGEDSPYVAAYEEVCSRLVRLDLDVSAGDTAWLTDVLRSIHDLQETMKKLYEGQTHLDRIVRAAKQKGNGPLGEIRKDLKRIRAAIRSKVEEYAHTQVKEAIERSLMGLLDSLQYAIARELGAEVNRAWQIGLGKQLAGFSRRYPFEPNADSAVDPQVFDSVFSKGGEFDDALDWIGYLTETGTEIGYVALTPDFQRDREFVRRAQRAMYAKGSEALVEAQLYLQRRGNMTSVRLVLDDATPIEARGTVEPRIEWRPRQGAKVVVHEVQVFDQKLDSAIDFSGKPWGLVRLLAVAASRPGITPRSGGPEYVEFKWDGFKHPATGQPLEAEAALLLRTESDPNPLTQGFFTHEFSDEVFGAAH